MSIILSQIQDTAVNVVSCNVQKEQRNKKQTEESEIQV
jgi:hypothetical protein